ncbi:MAG: glycerophosphodiester phosphodiesterase [Thermomicrobiales bacterium]
MTALRIPRGSYVEPDRFRVLVVAHRALSAGVAENSLAGIRQAANAGADLVELDVRRSLDGVPYLLHDRSLRRTATGFAPLRALPSRRLDQTRLRGSDEQLPRLEAALEALPAGVGPALHLKDKGSLRAALRVIQTAGVDASTWLWLHGTDSARIARQVAPEARVTVLEAGASSLAEWVIHLDGAVAAGATGVSIPWHDLTPALLSEIRSRELVAFSLNHDVNLIPPMLEAGLGGVITDYPEATRRVLDAMRDSVLEEEG